ncbi:MAG TPA: plastocyanin/azurin family copper-binding protein [Terriglobales bacterium]|jgi:plastocyanin|nr:plastocyanin/azurin family copper-binding protein [Terriglobales bacterium]
MKSIRRKAVGILFSGLLVANFAQAGEVKGKVSAAGLKSAENIAVYIDAIPGKKFDHPTKHVAVDQRNLIFAPHTVVILQGTTVDFLNGDNVAHNVYWPSINGEKRFRHNLTIVSPSQMKSFEFNDLGAAQILCNLHPDMIGYVLVVPTPYFALTGNDGTFSIKDVPPGNYTLKTWSEDGKPTTQTITAADAATSVELTVKK